MAPVWLDGQLSYLSCTLPTKTSAGVRSAPQWSGSPINEKRLDFGCMCPLSDCHVRAQNQSLISI